MEEEEEEQEEEDAQEDNTHTKENDTITPHANNNKSGVHSEERQARKAGGLSPYSINML